MRVPRLQFSLRWLMVAVAVAALVLLILKPNGPRYRHVEVFHRDTKGSITHVEMMRFDLDAPVDQFHGFPDGKTTFNQQVAHLRAIKAEY